MFSVSLSDAPQQFFMNSSLSEKFSSVLETQNMLGSTASRYKKPQHQQDFTVLTPEQREYYKNLPDPDGLSPIDHSIQNVLAHKVKADDTFGVADKFYNESVLNIRGQNIADEAWMKDFSGINRMLHPDKYARIQAVYQNSTSTLEKNLRESSRLDTQAVQAIKALKNAFTEFEATFSGHERFADEFSVVKSDLGDFETSDARFVERSAQSFAEAEQLAKILKKMGVEDIE